LPFKDENQRLAYMRQYRKRNKLLNSPDLQSFLNAIQDCSKCKSVPPCVFVTSEKIPLCEEHWSLLADSNVCFGEPIDCSEVVEVLSPLDQKGFISKEAYDREKNGQNVWHTS